MENHNESVPKIDFEALEDGSDMFVLETIMGEGTFSQVFKARDKKKGKYYAVKVYDDLNRTMSEAEQEHWVFANHAIHPNLPTFFGMYKVKGPTPDKNQLYVMMELCDGGSVSDLVVGLKKMASQMGMTGEGAGRLSEYEVAYIIKETNNALVYLHTHKIAHRDVKAANVLLTKDASVKVVDFGISSRFQATTDKKFTSVGTPFWMAPEVIMSGTGGPHDNGYDFRCDTWSLAITAIEVAESRPPLMELHPMRALFQIPRNPPPWFRDESLWSEEFLDFVRECLVKNYEERPASFELQEHEFFLKVPANPSKIKAKLVDRLWALKGKAKKGAPEITPTVRKGLLKKKRNVNLTQVPVDDLSAMLEITEDTVTKQLRDRYTRETQIYTYIGEILVAINPYKDIGVHNPSEMNKYRNQFKFDNPPHTLAVANHAYHAMIHEKRNQRILVSGESGAGKTTNANIAMTMLVYLGRAERRNIEDKILQLIPILEAFGNARTKWNENSSRYAKFVQLFFSRVGKVTGARVNVFMLESSRVTMLNKNDGGRGTHVLQDDQNFHIFDSMLKGLKKMSRMQEFCLEDGKKYQMMGPNTADNQAVPNFDQLMTALKMFGFRDEELNSILTVLAAVIILGEVEFSGDDESSQVSDNSSKHITNLAKLLGVKEDNLKTELCQYNVQSKGEVIKKSNSQKESYWQRDTLARGLYSRVFDYIISTINKLLSYSIKVYGEGNNIGILDAFGFENNGSYENNSFETLCINTANEELQFFFNQHMFKWEWEEYITEGVPNEIDPRKADVNRATLDMLLARPIGLFSIIDEETKIPTGTDSSLVEKWNQHLEKTQMYSSSGLDRFTVKHFADPVDYNPVGFREKNRNFLSPDLIRMFRESEKDMVKYLFSCPMATDGKLQCDQNPYGAAAQHSQSRSQQTLATYFRYSLVELMRVTLDGVPHFIKCLKPNVTKQAMEWEEDFVHRQMKYNGIMDIVKARKHGFTHRLTFADFLRRYCFLGFGFEERVTATREVCQILLLRLKLDGYELGRSKVFLKYYHIEYLTKTYEYYIERVVRVQCAVRQWIGKKKMQKQKWNMARRAFLMKLYIRKWKNKAKKSAAEGGAHKMRRLSSAASKHAKELEKFATEGEDIKEDP